MAKVNEATDAGRIFNWLQPAHLKPVTKALMTSAQDHACTEYLLTGWSTTFWAQTTLISVGDANSILKQLNI